MIVVFGSVNLDLVFPVPALPGPGETVLGGVMRSEPGGKGANQAVAAARDGAVVALAGAVGDDAFAAPALAGLHAAGVDLSRLATAPGTSGGTATGAAAIAVDPAGANQITVSPGANLLAKAAQVSEADLSPDTTLLLQMEVDPAETAALIARAGIRGARIVLSLAPYGPLPREALAAVDVLLLNESEAEALAARLGCTAEPQALHARLDGPVVIVTRGEQGAFAATDEEVLHQPAITVVVRDTTAAGDCFAGVLAAALDRGDELPEAMRRAAAAAAVTCSRVGSQASIAAAEETDALLAVR